MIQYATTIAAHFCAPSAFAFCSYSFIYLFGRLFSAHFVCLIRILYRWFVNSATYISFVRYEKGLIKNHLLRFKLNFKYSHNEQTCLHLPFFWYTICLCVHDKCKHILHSHAALARQTSIKVNEMYNCDIVVVSVANLKYKTQIARGSIGFDCVLLEMLLTAFYAFA